MFSFCEKPQQRPFFDTWNSRKNMFYGLEIKKTEKQQSAEQVEKNNISKTKHVDNMVFEKQYLFKTFLNFFLTLPKSGITFYNLL